MLDLWEINLESAAKRVGNDHITKKVVFLFFFGEGNKKEKRGCSKCQNRKYVNTQNTWPLQRRRPPPSGKFGVCSSPIRRWPIQLTSFCCQNDTWHPPTTQYTVGPARPATIANAEINFGDSLFSYPNKIFLYRKHIITVWYYHILIDLTK